MSERISAGAAVKRLVTQSAEQLQRLLAQSVAQMRSTLDDSLATLRASLTEAQEQIDKSADAAAHRAEQRVLSTIADATHEIREEIAAQKRENDALRGRLEEVFKVVESLGEDLGTIHEAGSEDFTLPGVEPVDMSLPVVQGRDPGEGPIAAHSAFSDQRMIELAAQIHALEALAEQAGFKAAARVDALMFLLEDKRVVKFTDADVQQLEDTTDRIFEQELRENGER